MPVQFKFFMIPFHSGIQAETDLNLFLRSHRVLTIHREFVNQAENACWCMAGEYLTDSGKPGDAKKEPGGLQGNIEPGRFRRFCETQGMVKGNRGKRRGAGIYHF